MVVVEDLSASLTSYVPCIYRIFFQLIIRMHAYLAITLVQTAAMQPEFNSVYYEDPTDLNIRGSYTQPRVDDTN